MNNTIKTRSNMLEALVQNYGFKKTSYEKLPTIDFLYPDYTANGNSEDFRFFPKLRSELRERSKIVRENLAGKSLVWTLDEQTMLEVDKIVPRLGLDDQISGKINSIYSYSPFLFVGQNEKDFAAYVVKPVIDASMAWFELTNEEQDKVYALLAKKAADKPYRSFIQRLFLGGRK